MDMLKQIWPMPFNIKEKDIVSFLVQLIIFVLVCGVAGWLIAKLAGIAIIGIIFTLVGSLLEIYGLVGIILCVLVFLGIVK